MAYAPRYLHGGLSNTEQLTDEHLTCRVCNIPGFRVPKMLPQCGHTFCKHCIEQKLGISPGVHYAIPFPCFICGVKSRLPRSGVEGLPPDLCVGVQIDTILRRQNCDRGRVESLYNIHDYLLDPDSMYATLPLPGQPRNH